MCVHRPHKMSVATCTDEVRLLREENAVLRTQIEWLKKQLFGSGKGEKLDRAQLMLKLGELEKLEEAARKIETITYERTKGTEKRVSPAEAFQHLPVKETVVIEPEEVKAEPEAFEKIGEERTFEVDIIPPQAYRREFVRPKYRRKDNREAAPVLAPAPKRLVTGGFASAGLVAWVVNSKFCDHLPMFRQEGMLERWGAKISRQAMSDWIRLAAEALEPLHKRMKQDLLGGGYVQVDETPVRCNDPDIKDGKTTQGWLWALSQPGGNVVFEWRLSRRHDEADTLLGDYRGILQSDGYEAYPAYVRAHEGVTWVGCWAHARRRFFEAVSERPADATKALELIGQLYHLESQWDDQKIGETRTALRQEHFARPLAELKAHAQGLLAGPVLPQSVLGKACTYLLGHWEPLTAHLRYSNTKLDTNSVENAIRPSKLGAKNWLFIGHPDAGDRAAILYSIVVSCRRYGKDSLAYLRDVLTRLPAMTNQDDLSALLPANWQPVSQS